jgi:hypothetical protein
MWGTILPLVVLSQASSGIEIVTGGAGWAGAGLLGAVLGWLLLKHLPEKDAQIERLIKRHDEALARVSLDHENEMKETRKEFREALSAITGQNERSVVLLTQAIREESERVIRGTYGWCKNMPDEVRDREMKEWREREERERRSRQPPQKEGGK